MMQNTRLTIPAVFPSLGGEAYMMMEDNLGAHLNMALDIVRGNEHFNLPVRMRFAESFAKGYNFPLSAPSGEADAAAQSAFFRRFADGIRPQFSTDVKYVAGHNVVNLFNAQGLGGVNFPDLVAAGLVTAEAAKSLQDSVADSAQRMVDSGVYVLGKAASWYSPSRVIPRIGLHVGIFGGVYHILSSSDFQGGSPAGVAFGAIIFSLLIGEALFGGASSGYYSRQKQNCTEGLAALLGARKAFEAGIGETEKKAWGPEIHDCGGA